MGDQCRAKRGDVRCQRDKGHEGHHRAEHEKRIHDWAEAVQR